MVLQINFDWEGLNKHHPLAYLFFPRLDSMHQYERDKKLFLLQLLTIELQDKFKTNPVSKPSRRVIDPAICEISLSMQTDILPDTFVYMIVLLH